ncbi:MAG: ABC transporter permease subunit, partial [Actinobacteria bacterium]|nr:ABC transporter permease subunit [Actinomycetota bacterium]
MMRKVVALACLLVAILVLAAWPDVLFVEQDAVVFRPSAVFTDVVAYVRGVADGTSFVYGFWDERSLFAGLDTRIVNSFLYMVVAGLLAVAMGPALGIWLTAGRHDRLKDAVTLTGAVPDFVLALLLQIVVVAFYKSTGHRLARVASIDSSRPAILLPLLVLSLVPMVYLVRTVSTRTYQIVTEPFVTVARARGAARRRIYLTQVLPNVTRYLRADVSRVTGLILADFFIVDYLFNLRGITTLIFSFGLKGGYR